MATWKYMQTKGIQQKIWQKPDFSKPKVQTVRIKQLLSIFHLYIKFIYHTLYSERKLGPKSKIVKFAQKILWYK